MGAGDVVQALAHSFARVYSELYRADEPRFYRAECREACYACAPAAVGGADVQFAVCAHVRHGAERFVAAIGGDGVMWVVLVFWAYKKKRVTCYILSNQLNLTEIHARYFCKLCP